MPVTIDVTGLREPVVDNLRRLVDTLRGHQPPKLPVTPPPDETPEQWVARFRAWVESHPKRQINFDDSRDSIYGGPEDRGE